MIAKIDDRSDLNHGGQRERTERSGSFNDWRGRPPYSSQDCGLHDKTRWQRWLTTAILALLTQQSAGQSGPTIGPTSREQWCELNISQHLTTLTPDGDGTIEVPEFVEGCNVYADVDATATIFTNYRVPNITRALKFRGENLSNVRDLHRFAPAVSNLPAINLDLIGNFFTTLPSASFLPFGYRLRELDLTGSRITAVSRAAFAGVTGLEVLLLRDTYGLSFLPDGWLVGLRVLRILDLAHGGIRIVTNNTFSGPTNLTAITLAGNPIIAMATAPFSNMSQLEPGDVDLGNTSLLCVPVRRGSHGTLPLCLGCSTDDGNTNTVFRQTDGNFTCEASGTLFSLANASQRTPSTAPSGITYLRWDDRTRWVLGRTYRVRPVDYAGSVLADGRVVLGAVEFAIANPPPGLFIKSNSGEMLFSPLQPHGPHTCTVTATHPDFPGRITLATMTFEVLPDDINNPNATGPNGLECANGGTPVDTYNGATEFDLQYECACPTGFIGPNCNDHDVVIVPTTAVQQVEKVGVIDALDWSTRTRWAVGKSYFLKPVNITSAVLSTGGAVNTTNFRYFIQPAPPGLLLDPDTGFAQITPQAPATIVSVVYAALPEYPDTPIGQIDFEARFADVDNPLASGPGGRDCANGGTRTDIYDGQSEFDLTFACLCTGDFTGPNCAESLAPLQLHVITGGQYIPEESTLTFEAPGEAEKAETPRYSMYTRTQWAVQHSYRIAPVNLIKAAVSRSRDFNWTAQASEIVDVTPTFDIVPMPRGFFIDSATGEFIGQPETIGTNVSTLYAVFPNAERAFVTTINFTVVNADTAVPEYGPNGKDCANPAQRVDSVPFDASFSCNCTATSSIARGDNCESEAARSMSREDTSNWENILIATAVTGVVLIFVLIGLVKIRKYRSDHTAIDLAAFQADILSTLGVGTTLDIGSFEFGILLTLRNIPGLYMESERLEFNESILDAINNAGMTTSRSRFRGSGRKRKPVLASLSTHNARVSIDKNSKTVLIILQQPPERADIADKVAEEIQAAVDAGAFFLPGGLMVTDVSVAVPKCVPREIDRRSVVEISIIGSGHFGKVSKVEVSESHRPKYLAAAKILKTLSIDARDELLREAALGALLAHPNVVGIEGVVTVPRSLPPVLLLPYCENGNLKTFVTEEDDLNDEILLTFCADVAAGMHYLSSRRIVHRDLAARNVLVDSQLICLVSDFGMSTALNDGSDDSTYAGSYVRVECGAMAIRWSAIEVLVDRKFSRASDVWAFGCLVYEVLTRGLQPYPEQRTLMEVTEFIKSGGTMKCPPACSSKIFEDVMVPCWAQQPSHRPGFAALTAILVDHGAEEPVDNTQKVSTLLPDSRPVRAARRVMQRKPSGAISTTVQSTNSSTNSSTIASTDTENIPQLPFDDSTNRYSLTESPSGAVSDAEVPVAADGYKLFLNPLAKLGSQEMDGLSPVAVPTHVSNGMAAKSGSSSILDENRQFLESRQSIKSSTEPLHFSIPVEGTNSSIIVSRTAGCGV